MIKKQTIAYCFVLIHFSLCAQQFSALNGSAFAGALSVHNNPATHAALIRPWDLTLVAGNLFLHKNNAVNFPRNPFDLLQLPGDIRLIQGSYPRFFRGHQKGSLLNLVLRLNLNNYVAAGINIRSYMQVTTSHISIYDSIQNPSEFLDLNINFNPVEAAGLTNNWVEGYITYGHSFIKSETSALIVGATLKLMRGSAGVYAQLKDGQIEAINDGAGENKVVSANVDYALSRNLERIDRNSNLKNVIEELLAGTKPTFGLDAGVEYVRFRTASNNGYYQYYDPSQHDFAIGVAVSDLGRLKYQNGIHGRKASVLKPDITGELLDNKFNEIAYFEDFTDTIETLYDDARSPGSQFVMPLPSKLIVNADKYIRNNIYINAQFSVPLAQSSWSSTKQVTEVAHLIITPRWELSLAGIYLPMLVTTSGELMPGIAFRIGPLLAGVHDLSRVGKKNYLDRGGYYAAISLRPDLFAGKARECPEF